MPPPAMTKRELLDVVMGGRLAAYVEARRPLASWQRIAGDIREEFGVAVSDESLRQWFPETR